MHKIPLLLAYFNSQTTEFHTGIKQSFQSMQERKQSFHFLPHSANQSIHDQIPAKNSRYICTWAERSFHSRTTFASLFPFANEPTVQPQPTDLLVKAEPSKVPNQSGLEFRFRHRPTVPFDCTFCHYSLTANTGTYRLSNDQVNQNLFASYGYILSSPF